MPQKSASPHYTEPLLHANLCVVGPGCRPFRSDSMGGNALRNGVPGTLEGPISGYSCKASDPHLLAMEAGMRTAVQFPHEVVGMEHEWITLADGCRLAARLWLPEDAGRNPVPAILEYLPYRKRDGTRVRDELTHPYLAGHGYACVRVDMRGNGESDGLMLDEYLPQEQADALEVIAWLAAQPWCSGVVGMMGISWGGFNALQVAALRPPALRAIITLCSTDDRYADDIHYKGGAMLLENLGWAATMFSYSSRPPDPALVGEGWRDTWMQRLQNTPLLLDTWLRHPHRDAYWKQGSVCENFAAIEAAVLAVGGWGDAYSNAVPRLLSGIAAPRRAIVGPWVHKYPHFAKPEPAIGFLQEALRWWDQWLKGHDTGILDEPLYRAYMMDSARPAASYEQRDGRWISENEWPARGIEPQRLFLNPHGLEAAPAPSRGLTVCSPQTTGAASGEYCAIWLGPDWPTDQREDDAGSLCFDGEPLAVRLELFGAPEVELDIAADRPQANVIVRLCDVWPDGACTRISYGVLNLCHRDSHESPSALLPGQRYRVRVRLDDIAYAVAPGHRLRVAISSACWPLIWPSPEMATLTVWTGASTLLLPTRPAREDRLRPFEEPEAAPPLRLQERRPGGRSRRLERDMASGLCTLAIDDDFGVQYIVAADLEVGSECHERYRILPHDPLSAHAEVHWVQTLAREGWDVRTETRSTLVADSRQFHLHASMLCHEGGSCVFKREWRRQIPRLLL